jgi:hypothetical protein
MTYEDFMRALVRAIAVVEDQQDIECFDAQKLIDGVADTRLGPDTREVLIDFCKYYAEVKVEFIFKDEFESLMKYNKVVLENETDS